MNIPLAIQEECNKLMNEVTSLLNSYQIPGHYKVLLLLASFSVLAVKGGATEDQVVELCRESFRDVEKLIAEDSR